VTTCTENDPEFPSDDFMGARIWRGSDCLHIDVSTLHAPDPFVATMRLILHPAVGDQIIFHNDRDPVHLYPELLEKGWIAEPMPSEDGSFILNLIRVTNS